MPFVKDWILELFFYQGIPVKFSSFLSQLKCQYTKYISQLTQTSAFMCKWPSPRLLVVIWFHGYARPSLKMFGNWIKCSQLWELCQNVWLCNYLQAHFRMKNKLFFFLSCRKPGHNLKTLILYTCQVGICCHCWFDSFNRSFPRCKHDVLPRSCNKKSWHSPLVPYPLVLLMDSLVAFMD